MPNLSTGAAGVPATNKVPAMFLEVVLGAGVNTAGGSNRFILLIGQKLTAGLMVADADVKLFTSQSDADAQAGQNSELALMYETAAGLNPGATIYGVAPAEPSGVKATATITVAGTAGGAGTARFIIHGVEVAVSVNAGDVQNTIAANIAAAINGSTGFLKGLLVTATVATNVVTVTYRHQGTRGNETTIRKDIDTSITTTTFTLSGATLSGGTGTESLTNVLAAISAATYKYYASAANTTTLLQAIQTQLSSMAGPLQGRRQYVISAARNSLGTDTTQAQTLNENRAQIAWHKNSETPTCIIAAAIAAVRARGESDKISVNLDGTDLYPYVKAQPAPADWPSDPVKAAALDVGLSVLAVDPITKHVTLVRSITTHSLANSAPDVRTLDTVKVVVPDYFADVLAAAIPSNFPNLNLIDDPTDATDDELPPGTTTPSAVKRFCAGIARGLQADGHITKFDDDYASWAFNLAPASPGRVNATMPIHVVDGFHQFSGQIRQVG